MGMEFGTFDPQELIVTVGPIIITGFGDGDSITVSRETDNFFDMAGLDGSVGRMRSADKRGTITIGLLQTSKANDLLSAAFNLESLTNDISVALPVLVADKSGRTVIAASKAWLQKVTDVGFSKETLNGRSWPIRCADLMIYAGGND